MVNSASSAWSDPAGIDRNIAWTREFFNVMGPFVVTASYISYIDDEGIEGLWGSYGEEKFRRLAAIKSRDPTNLFRINQNIAPGGHGARMNLTLPPRGDAVANSSFGSPRVFPV